jgi:pimeloyl-ACP methyl ester carboxylesterase
MKRTRLVPAGLLALSMLGQGCSDDPAVAAPADVGASDTVTDAADVALTDADAQAADAGNGTDADAEPAEPDCNDEALPIVAAHGFLASGDTWAKHATRFEQRGDCPGRFYAFDWNSLDRGADHVEDLDALIDAILLETGAAAVDLMGHSAGGGLGYDYLDDAARAAKVAHYVHIGSFANEGPAGPDDAPVATLNLWSPDDLIVEESGDIDGATNVSLPGADHYAVATSEASFEAIYTFLRGQAPEAPEPRTRLEMAGRALSFGENTPAAGAAVTIWALDPATGQRAGDAPLAAHTTDDAGRFPATEIEAGVPYELVVDDGSVPVHYFREPFEATNRLVYLRTLPGPGTLAGVVTSLLPLDGDDTVLIVFSSSEAIVDPDDTLTLDDTTLGGPETTAATNTTIALFLYDANNNGETDATPVDALAQFPFLSGVDIALDGDAAQTSEVRLNDRVVRFPRLPASEYGAVVVTFD